jgi:uncharacterized tellurite resistance protein B-like protein
MPIIAIVLSGIVSGLFLWLTSDGGLERIDQLLRERRDRKRREKALEQQSLAPLRALKDPRDAAAVLMVAVAEARGVMTPEQQTLVQERMGSVLGFADAEIGARLVYARHAARQAPSIDAIVADLTDLVREKLSRAERRELETMLDEVAALHGGPTDAQERRSRSRPAASPRQPDLPASAIGRNTRIRQPHGLRRLAGLPEHVDRHAAARIPIAADAQIPRLEQLRQALADRDGAILVEGAVIAEAVEEELERFRLDEPAVGHVVDHEKREVRLAGHRTERRELRRGETGDVVRVGMRVRHAVEPRLVGRGRDCRGPAEVELVVHGCASLSTAVPGLRAAKSPEPINTTPAKGVSAVSLPFDGGVYGFRARASGTPRTDSAT